MKISVEIKPRSKSGGIAARRVENGAETYVVRVTSRPIEGKANRELIRVLAHHFDTTPSRIRIIAGFRGRKKIVEIDGE